MGNNKNEAERRKEFEGWLAQMEEQLAHFLNSFEDSVKEKLDFTPESFDVLEAMLLTTFSNSFQLNSPQVNNFVDYLARYIGETIVRNINAKWELELSDPKDELYGMPIIVDSEGNEFIACPHALPTATVNRKTQHFLRTLLLMLMDEWGSDEEE